MIERRRSLQGYELYLVEQWACSREHLTFVIVTFTGDPSHSALVSVLSIPTDEKAWSPRLRLYFKAVSQHHARRKETPLGILMVTNLSGFPSALTVILVPDGDIRKHREELIVNEDLKRLGCSGRAGLKLAPPTDATQSKFYQLYKTSDRIPFHSAVTELVKLCQLALMLFAKLGAEYADGLLCDVTERAINDWWTEMGTEFYNSEPRDGILGPTTVAAMLGMLMGARNRLSAYGAPVAKDAFDVGNTKRGIAYFQKAQKLPVTRRLDRQTLDKLHRVTAKVASGEGWMVPKTVKSTMAELSGKGGEMVMGMVGARDKVGIAEIETLDMEHFAQLVHGEKCKWLWYGKPRKSMENDSLDELGGFGESTVSKERNDDSTSLNLKRDLSHAGGLKNDSEQRAAGIARSNNPLPDSPAGATTETLGDRDPYLRKNVLKSVTARRNDARSGFGRIKDAVGISGLRGHQHKLSRGDASGPESLECALNHGETQGTEGSMGLPQSRPSSSRNSLLKVDTEGSDFLMPINSRTDELRKERVHDAVRSGVSHGRSDSTSPSASKLSLASYSVEPQIQDNPRVKSLFQSNAVDLGVAPVKSIQAEQHASAVQSCEGHISDDPGLLLKRTQSWSSFIRQRHEKRHDSRWPRHLSFGAAEETTLSWKLTTYSDSDRNIADGSLQKSLLRENAFASEAKERYARMLQLRDETAGWAQQRLEDVELVDDQANRHLEQLHTLYYQRLKDYEGLRQISHDSLIGQRKHLIEAIREIDVLGAKLDYEVNALAAKVEDVEDGVEGIERQVYALEVKAQEYDATRQIREGWLRWALKVLTGLDGGSSST